MRPFPFSLFLGVGWIHEGTTGGLDWTGQVGSELAGSGLIIERGVIGAFCDSLDHPLLTNTIYYILSSYSTYSVCVCVSAGLCQYLRLRTLRNSGSGLRRGGEGMI